MRKFSFLLFAVLAASASGGEIYKWVEPDGTVVYSDQPREGAQPLNIEIPVTRTRRLGDGSSSTPATPAEAAKAADEAVGYSKLAIVAPENDATVRENSGAVAVTLVVSPQLHTKAGHSIQLTLDGRVIVEGSTNTQFMLNNVDRGTHTLAATIIASDGKPLISASPVTFHMKRISVLHPPPAGASP